MRRPSTTTRSTTRSCWRSYMAWSTGRRPEKCGVLHSSDRPPQLAGVHQAGATGRATGTVGGNLVAVQLHIVHRLGKDATVSDALSQREQVMHTKPKMSVSGAAHTTTRDSQGRQPESRVVTSPMETRTSPEMQRRSRTSRSIPFYLARATGSMEGRPETAQPVLAHP